MPEAPHIIKKVFLEVNTHSSKEAFEIKDNLGAFLKHQLFPKIESYFKTQSALFSGSTIRFNKIEIDVDQADMGNLPAIRNKIVHQLKKKIERAFQKAITTNDSNVPLVVPNSKSEMDVFFHFLRTGLRPWWKPDFLEFLTYENLKSIKIQDDFYTEFVKALSTKNARQRLVNQFDDTILSLLVATLATKKVVAKQKAFRALEKNPKLRNPFWIAVIDSYRLKSGSKVNTMLKEFSENKTIDLNEYQALEDFATSLSNRPSTYFEGIELALEKEAVSHEKEAVPNKKEAVSHENLIEEGLYVNNAGLVLLHPFFKQLFINAKLADANSKIIEAEVETAIHLLHYLCTKEEQQLESELILEKFLCGCPINKPINRFIKLPEEMKQMAEDLLQSAITHWTALKNTSPDGLRSGFLQRDGKLIVTNGSCRLIVERKGLDILLDKIPWNIHLIKLPWRNEIIHVEW